MKLYKKQGDLKSKRREYHVPKVQSTEIDHEISLVMMSESGTPPIEFSIKLSRRLS